MMKWGLPSRLTVLRAGATASILAALIVTVGPVLQGPVQFSPQRALELFSFLALLWATVFAAENLRELRVGRELEYAPILHVSAVTTHVGGGHNIKLLVRNIGRGPAIEVSLAAFIRDDDNRCWARVKSEPVSPMLGADAETQSLTEISIFDLLAREEPCDVVVVVKYRDAFRNEHAMQLGFKMDAARKNGVWVEVNESLSAAPKIGLISELMARARQDGVLLPDGCSLDVLYDQPEPSEAIFRILTPRGKAWVRGFPLRAGAFEIEAWLRETTREIQERRHASPDEDW